MANKILIIAILAVIGGAVFLGAGYLAGIGVKQEQPKNFEKTVNAVKSLSSSKVVPSITAMGKVTKISGRNITLTNGEESIEIYIKDDAKIYSSQKESNFGAITVGDNLNIRIKISPDGQIDGSSVVIMPTLESPVNF